MIIKKETIFCLMFQFEHFDHFIAQKKFLIEKVSKSFNKFYMINSTKLEIGKKHFITDIESLKKKVPLNCKIIDPNGSKEFLDFSRDKNLVIYCSFGRLWRFFKIHFILNKINAKLIYVHEIGMLNSVPLTSTKSAFIRFFYYELPHKVVILLCILKIFPKVDLRFLSNKSHYDKAINNFFYKISKKFKYLNFFYTKDFELINSLSYDHFKSNEIQVSEEKIVFVDTNINHQDTINEGGGVDDETYEKCYKDIEKYLKMLSKIFNKPVTVCIHPSVNLNKIKKFLKDFEVVKYKTKENIYKSFIVLFYNSAAIVDAFFLKKRIITIENERMGDTWVKAVTQYPAKLGLVKINIQKEDKILDKDIFLRQLDDVVKSKKYESFIKESLTSDNSGMLGTDKVISIIKKKYFIYD
jgi:hypothetical protein